MQKGHDGLEGEPHGLFYSHGGGGSVRAPLENLFTHLGGEQVGQTVESRGRPNAAALRACKELGTKLARAITDP